MVGKPKLLEQIAIKVRQKHYSRSTEKTYCAWAKKYILFHNKRHPREMGKIKIKAFLSDLVVTKYASASTQKIFSYSLSLNKNNISNLQLKKIMVNLFSNSV